MLVACVVGLAVVAYAVVRFSDHPPYGDQNRSLTASERHGRAVFARNCSSCHTLRASNATAQIGPDLDYSQPTVEQVEHFIANGGRSPMAVMPSGLVTLDDARDVARYVHVIADRRSCCGQ